MTDKTLHDARIEYLEHLRSEGKSERSIYTYSRDLDQVERFFGPDKKLEALLISHAAGFLKSDTLHKLPNGKDRAKPTVEKTIRVFRMFIVWAKGQGYLSKLPFPKEMPMGRDAVCVEESAADEQ